jgi:hypothetical protein
MGKNSMTDRLHYRRQFLLSKASITQLAEWKCLKIDQFYLYTHPDLEVNQVADSKKRIVLIGDIFDSEDYEKTNVDLLNDIIVSASSKEALFLQIKRYAGSYVLLYKDVKEHVIFSDARAVREIYYCTGSNEVVCGSQPNIIVEFANPEIKVTCDQKILDFYNNHLVDSSWIGDETYFDGVKHLIPNHFFDINKHEAFRYWPNEPIKRLHLVEAVTKSCKFLQGIMNSILHRHQVIMAITAGTDTRTLLAASKGMHDKIHYFVSNCNLGHTHPDISVPKKIFENIGIPFQVYDVPDDVDNEFRKIYRGNTFLASEHYLPPIYHVFFKKHSKKMCVLGVGEIGRTFYGEESKRLNGFQLAYKLRYKNCPYVISKCKKILDEMLPVARKYSLNVLVLLYWEQRLGNWGAVRNSESQIAIDKVDPFNSYQLNEIFLGVDEKYKNYTESPCVLFREMIFSMWPELLEWPINPPCDLRGKTKLILNKIGLFGPLKELKYQLDYLTYLCKIRL